MSIQKIETNNGIYECKENVGAIFKKFEKPINIEVSTRNLLDFQKILDKNNIAFTLMYGTLLGAVREKGFIPHDHDTDTVVFREQEEAVLDTIFELREVGLEVGRYTNALISFVRDGDFIDIYFMDKKGSKYYTEGYVIPRTYLDNLIEYPFLGSIFRIPQEHDKLLEYFYGKDWQIPKENVSPTHYGPYLKVKYFIKNHSESTFKIISWIKGKLHV